jgi:hypothetical protein
MFGKKLAVCLSAAFALSVAAAENTPTKLSANEIADRNATARGGLQAWRNVKTLVLAGKMGAGGNQRATLQVPNTAPAAVVTRKNNTPLLPSRPVEEVQLPFRMDLARPRKMRFELDVAGQTAIQVYDGTNGWKLRPYLNRRVVEPFTEDELAISSRQSVDGQLMDYVAKGTSLELIGTERVEDHDAYKIKMTMKSGQALHVWIDAQTFLETKIEGAPRRMDGTQHPVETYFRDYRTVEGLQIPFILETRVLPVTKTTLGFRDVPVPPERILVEKVIVNPKLDEALFAKLEPGATAVKLQ